MAMHVKQLVMIGLLAIVTGAVMTPSGLAAEQDGSRKATKKVAPSYPPAARKLQLTGTVRLAAMVAPDGRVKSTEIIGGHPLLVAAVTVAVMQWKYEAAERESRELLMFAFAP